MKKIIKNNILGIIIGGILFGGIGVGATILYQSTEVEYSPTDTTWEVNNVKEALDQLHETRNGGELKYVQAFDVRASYNAQCHSQTYTLNSNIKKGILIAGYSSYTSGETMTTSSGLTCTTTSGSCTPLNNTAGGIYYGVYGTNIFLIENISADTKFTLQFCQSRQISYNYIYGHVYSL